MKLLQVVMIVAALFSRFGPCWQAKPNAAHEVSDPARSFSQSSVPVSFIARSLPQCNSFVELFLTRTIPYQNNSGNKKRESAGTSGEDAMGKDFRLHRFISDRLRPPASGRLRVG